MGSVSVDILIFSPAHIVNTMRPGKSI